MNNYQYLISIAMEGDNKTFFITLGFLICIAIMVYLFFRSNASEEGEYIEVADEDKDGELYIPVRYKIYNGSGYSDHLPIICKISF